MRYGPLYILAALLATLVAYAFVGGQVLESGFTALIGGLLLSVNPERDQPPKP